MHDTALDYYKSKEDEKPVKRLDISNASVDFLPSPSATGSTVLRINAGSQKLTLKSTDEDDLKTWMQMMNLAKERSAEKRGLLQKKVKSILKNRMSVKFVVVLRLAID